MLTTAKEKRVLFSGYAKLPAGITASEIYKIVGITVIIDISTGTIVDADCTLATQVARHHVATALIGYSLQDGPDELIHIIEQIYQGSAKKAIITALRIIYDKYRSYHDELIQINASKALKG